MADVALSVKNLTVSYGIPGTRHRTQAVLDVSLTVAQQSVVALVGESGSGKSSTARAVMGLTPRDAGEIEIAGTRWICGSPFPQAARSDIQMVFQDPFSSLNPVWSVGRSIAEPLRNLGNLSEAQQRLRVEDTMKLVGLDPAFAGRRPKAFSGGQRQRVAIARAVIADPKVLVCDEAVSALDVSTKNQILALLRELRDRLSVGILFITHDIAVVRQIADTVAVMYLGRVVEVGSTDQVLGAPRHPYSQLLRDSVPRVGWHPSHASKERSVESGDPSKRPKGCVYSQRCALFVEDECGVAQPSLEPTEGSTDRRAGHLVACARQHASQQNAVEEVVRP